MKHNVYAVCGCNVGKVRKNNEDNFCFVDKYLEIQNADVPTLLKYNDVVKDGLCFAVFDGMGGGYFGEIASYVSAYQMSKSKLQTPGTSNINSLIEKLNLEVVQEQREKIADDMGTTMASIHFSRNNVFISNISYNQK